MTCQWHSIFGISLPSLLGLPLDMRQRIVFQADGTGALEFIITSVILNIWIRKGGTITSPPPHPPDLIPADSSNVKCYIKHTKKYVNHMLGQNIEKLGNNILTACELFCDQLILRAT